MNEVQTPAAEPVSETTFQTKFTFRTDKIRDDEGKVIGVGRKHPEVSAVLPKPTPAELVEFLQKGGEEAKLILECVESVIFDAAKQQILEFRETNGLDATFTATNFDLSQLTLTAIANMPKAARKGSEISDEDWTAFLEDYHHTMAHVVHYEEKRVKLAVAHFKVKLVRIRNDKESVAKLQDLLNKWAAATPNLEDHMACYEDLMKRGEKYLKAEPKVLKDAL